MAPSVRLVTTSDSWEPLLGPSSSFHTLPTDLPPHSLLLGKEAQGQPGKERVDVECGFFPSPGLASQVSGFRELGCWFRTFFWINFPYFCHSQLGA